MRRKICPRCGSENIDWRIPQLWSMWDCKDCKYTGPVIEADDDLIEEIRADWEEHKEEYLEFERKRACKIVNDLCDEGEIYRIEEDELTDEEMDAKLRELNL